jgi:CRISPR-associated protein Csd1
MILQSLYDLYERLSEDPANGLPRPGYSLQNITFRMVIRPDGTLVEIQDARQEDIQTGKNGREKKTLRSITMVVPGQTKSAGPGINPCTLWDNLTYLCGYPQPDKSAAKAEKNRNRAPRCFEGSRLHHTSHLANATDPSILAVLSYFERYQPDELLPFIENLPVDARLGNGVFQLTGQTSFAHNGYRPDVSRSENSDDGDDVVIGQCLVTGKFTSVARLHEPKIKTFDPKGSLLVSFNERAYESFAKEDSKKTGQGRNSPVSEAAVFAYCNALNFLLTSRSRRFRIGDGTTVFWTDKPAPVEELLPWMMSGLSDPEDSEAKARLKKVLEKISQGTLANDDLGSVETRYYILGLSPNASRLSVRFWHTGTLGELVSNLKKHFDDLRIVRQWDETNSKNPEPIAPSVDQLLCQTSRTSDRIPPLLSGALMRSILLGTRYPDTLINGVMNRIRVVQKNPRGEGSLDNVSYLRASILKAWLIRNHQPWLKQKNITMKTALDKETPSISYQLGRLFAVYEQVQRAAHDFKLERTIRETMFSAASATPQSVFGRLDRLNKHHLAKLTPGSNRFYSDLIDEIHQKVVAPTFYPASLNLKEQSLFCIGYYHQRHDLRFKNKISEISETETA